MSTHPVAEALAELERRYAGVVASDVSLNLTRGKPAAAQLELSDDLDGILGGDYVVDGIDLRNYGESDGILGARQLGAHLLDVPAEAVIVGGNASLELMYHAMLVGWLSGWNGPDSAWRHRSQPTVLCPVPGYDRHFTICERLGLQMLPVAMRDDGPDMDVIEAHLRGTTDVVAMWCVPKHSNPTGVTFSEEAVARIARLGTMAGPDFRVVYDNAYAVHDLADPPTILAPIWPRCEELGTTESIIHIASTSKITWAGAGVAFLAGGPATLAVLRRHLSAVTIGPDKVNQHRHVRKLRGGRLQAHMAAHAAVIRPKMEATLAILERELTGIARWSTPTGGYFMSLWTPPGTASVIVGLAADAGVALTPAGAAFPYGEDPQDSHIRLAPTFPTLAEVEQAMEVVALCVRLATARSAAAGAHREGIT